MKISTLTPDNQIQHELGARLQRVRKQLDYTQAQLATAAGIGVATLRRIEDGQDSQLSSWIKLLKALDMLNSLDELLPEPYKSPMAEVFKQKSRRRNKDTSGSQAPKPIWGDELE